MPVSLTGRLLTTSGIAEGAMTEAENAQRGVIDAILVLHDDGIFRTVLYALWAKWIVINNPREAPVFGPPPDPPRYASSRVIQRHNEFEAALREWAQRFRLTQDLTRSGECFPWALDFGRAVCADKPFAPSAHYVKGVKMPPPGDWVSLNRPKPDENFSDWEKRIRPSLKAWYKKCTRQIPKQSRQKNPDRYKWFVLHVCGDGSYDQIALSMSAIRAHRTWAVTGEAVRKGIETVRTELEVIRKVPPPKRPKSRV
jgi:hypothetical protein